MAKEETEAVKRRDSGLLQPVDDEVRAEARNLIRTARHGALALLDDEGWPSVARVGLAADCNGQPIFPVSSLSGRVELMGRDRRASLLVGDPRRGDPLAHPRLTLKGKVLRMTDDDHERARRRYLSRHPKAKLYIDFKDFSLWRLVPESIAFNGGFGRAYAMQPDDVETKAAAWEDWHAMEGGAVEHMNDDHDDAVRLYATVLLGAPDGAWRLTGIDPQGIDLALGDDHRRLEFDAPLAGAEAVRPALVKLVKVARKQAEA
ncbi:MAG: DUF2470 domain-containing protein [Pseudomonadota bacterium]